MSHMHLVQSGVRRVIQDAPLTGNQCVDFGTRFQHPKTTPYCFDTATFQLGLVFDLLLLSESNFELRADVPHLASTFPSNEHRSLFCQFRLLVNAATARGTDSFDVLSTSVEAATGSATSVDDVVPPLVTL